MPKPKLTKAQNKRFDKLYEGKEPTGDDFRRHLAEELAIQKKELGLDKKCVIYINNHNFIERKCVDCGLEIDKKTEKAILD